MGKQFRVVLLTAFLAILATVAVIRYSNSAWPWAPTLAKGERPECPHDWKTDSISASKGFPAAGLALVGVATDVPEYHDCQRFIQINAVGEVGFGALQAVFAIQGLKENYVSRGATSPGFVSHERASSVLASAPNITQDTADKIGIKTTSEFKILTIAQIYSEGQYKTLGIDSTFNCLLLFWDAAETTPVYHAYMVGVHKEAQCQDASALDLSQSKRLYPTVVSPVTTLVGEPPVARWDREPGNNKYYIGILCPTGWCEIHSAPLYAPSEKYAAPTDLASSGKRQVVEVKGWYDEQSLASPVISIGGKPALDGVLGTVVPVPELEGRKMDDYRTGQWMPVAWVSLSAGSPKYFTKFNFAFGGLDGFGQPVKPPGLAAARNQIDLCFAPDADPKRCTGAPDPADKKCNSDKKNQGKWYAVIKAVTGGSKYYCVMYRPLENNIQPPGVVRWRWSVRDETIWISCPSGCCEVTMLCDENSPDCG